MGYPQYVAGQGDQINIRALGAAQGTVQLMGDNLGSIRLVKNNQVSERLKYIDIAYHYIRDLQQKKLIDVSYVPTNEMTADGLTKPLTTFKFQDFVKLLGMQLRR